MGADAEAVLWLNRLVRAWSPVEAAVRLLVNEYCVPVALGLGLLFLWFAGRGAERERWQRGVLAAVAAAGLANALVALSNLAYYRPRPFAALPVTLLFYSPLDSGFPANPAALGVAIAAGVGLRARRAALAFWALAALFAFARVAAGVHYPSDILGGLAVGLAAALLAGATLARAEPLVAQLLVIARRFGLA